MKINRALVLILILLGVGCQGLFLTRKPAQPSAPPDLTPVTVDYTDTDGFDSVLEAALVDEAPIIIVQTEQTKPDWEGRLNAWIAAWNMGGKNRTRTIRGQSPSLPLDAESLGQLRELIFGLLDRIEVAAEKGSTWWANERMRSRRVTLLRPYSLRFHRDADGPIRLVFFHGAYASYYSTFLRSLMGEPGMTEESWTRTVECSRCQKTHQDGIGKLVSTKAR